MELDLADVFAGAALGGNPLAVVRGGEGLTGAAMQALTRWLGFSETTFLLPPTDPAADYALRIFTPAAELPFAGHPTLGSAMAWLAAGGTPRCASVVMQQCGVGLVPVRMDAQKAARLAFRAPPLRRSGPLSAAERAAAIALAGVAEEQVAEAFHGDNGPGWQVLRLHSAAAVLAARPAPHAPANTDIGLLGPWPADAPEADGAAWELRGLFSLATGALGEDPVTGSLNAAVACHLFATGQAAGDYVAAQGRCVGAAGRIHVHRDAEGIWIGGDVAMVARGGQLAG